MSGATGAVARDDRGEFIAAATWFILMFALLILRRYMQSETVFGLRKELAVTRW